MNHPEEILPVSQPYGIMSGQNVLEIEKLTAKLVEYQAI